MSESFRSCSSIIRFSSVYGFDKLDKVFLDNVFGGRKIEIRISEALSASKESRVLINLYKIRTLKQSKSFRLAKAVVKGLLRQIVEIENEKKNREA